MSVLAYVALFFVCGLMAHRFIDHLDKPMDFRNIAGMVIHGAELVALSYLFRIISG